MTKKPKTYTAKFKMDIAIEALKGDLTLAQLSTKYGLHIRQITRWRDQLLVEGSEIFRSKHEKRRKTPEDQEKENLEKKIGQMTMEIDWLKKKLGE